MHNKKRGASASPTSNSQPFKSRGIPTVQYLEPCVSRLPPVSIYRERVFDTALFPTRGQGALRNVPR